MLQLSTNLTIMTTNKFRNKKTVLYGIEFSSVLEASRYLELRAMQGSGLISNLVTQPVITLLSNFTTQNEKGKKFKVRPLTYIADFSYTENGKEIIEDAKGVETEVFKIKRKLFMAMYRDKVFRKSYKKNGVILTEDRQYAE